MNTRPALTSDPQGGVTLSWPAGPTLRDVSGAVAYRIGEVSRTLALRLPDQAVRADGLKATWRWQPAENGYQVWMELSNDGDQPLYLQNKSQKSPKIHPQNSAFPLIFSQHHPKMYKICFYRL